MSAFSAFFARELRALHSAVMFFTRIAGGAVSPRPPRVSSDVRSALRERALLAIPLLMFEK